MSIRNLSLIWISRTLLSIMYFAFAQSSWDFAQSTAVTLPSSIQNFKTIGWLECMLWTNAISRDLSLRLVSERYPTLQPPRPTIKSEAPSWHLRHCLQPNIRYSIGQDILWPVHVARLNLNGVQVTINEPNQQPFYKQIFTDRILMDNEHRTLLSCHIKIWKQN